MNKKLLSLSAMGILTVSLLSLYVYSQCGLGRDSVFSMSAEIANSDTEYIQTSNASASGIRQPISTSLEVGSTELVRRGIDQAMTEVSLRLLEYQTDEALNELNALLEIFDELSDKEKARVLEGFAAYFTRKYQFEDAIFFYEATLALPNLDPDNRLVNLQMLARFALYEENWNAFLAYNDQYFAEGGEYKWFVTSQLVNAYQRLGNAEAAGDSLLLHLQTGIDPKFDNSDERYQRLYGETQYLPLMMSDPVSALELAQGMVTQFDRIENWKVLADLHQIQADKSNFNRIMDAARNRGFLDSSGDWLLSTNSQEN